MLFRSGMRALGKNIGGLAARLAGPGRRRASAPLALVAGILAALAWVCSPASIDANMGAEQQQGAAQLWVDRWPAPMSQFRVEPDTDCPAGPAAQCADVQAEAVDIAGNSRPATVWVWPAQNWSRAWLPFAQWRVARQIALQAKNSEYGKKLVAAGAQNDQVRFGTRNEPNEVGDSSWRIAFIDWPSAGGAELARMDVAARSEREEQEPLRVNSQSGPMAEFFDGLRLPVRVESGQWMILAQGPADQAARMTAALGGKADPGAIAVPKETLASATDKVKATPPMAPETKRRPGG